MSDDATFGSWLKRCRKARDLTQADLAQQVGCSAETIRKIEADGRRPSRQIAERLAHALEIPTGERAAFLQCARTPRSTAAPQAATPRAPHDAPAAAPPRPRSNLPPQTTPFIGREAELAEIAQLLDNPTCRLLSVIGTGGIGKTRLALEAAALRETCADGVFLVSLSSVAAAAPLAPAIAGALEFTFYDTADPTAQLLSYLRGKELLLILDNFEHLLDGAALLTTILQHAPRVKLLVTSRERLNLQGEWIINLQGLRVPRQDQDVRFDEYGAVALFLERARHVQAGFTLAAADRPSVARICRLVDGMPLAIELAAAWVRVLSCAEIAREIERNLDFLASSIRDTPERHRSLRAVFDHSWSLLSEHERQALPALSVLRGGFSHEAAARVAGASLPVLLALADKSLLYRTDKRRYYLHEVVRQYAAAHLQEAPSDLAAVQARHCAYYTALLKQHEPRLRGEEQRASMADFVREIDNLRLAWQHAVAQRQLSEIRLAARSLGYFYELRCWFQEAEAIFRQAVAELQAPSAPALGDTTEAMLALGQLLGHHGWFCFRTGQSEEAKALLRRSLALLRPLGPHVAVSDTLTWLGFVLNVTGESSEARELLTESLAVARATGDRWSSALALTTLGMVAHTQANDHEAQQLFHASLADWRAVGDPHGIAFSLISFSRMSRALEQHASAQALLRESLMLSSVLGDRWGIGASLNELGLIAHTLGEYQEAQYLFRESRDLFREIGDRWGMTQALINLGDVRSALGDYSAARQAFYEAIQTATEAQTFAIALDAMVRLSVLLARDGAAEQALALLAHAMRHPASAPATSERAAQLLAEISAALPPPQAEAAVARGQTQSFEAIIGDLQPSALTAGRNPVPFT